MPNINSQNRYASVVYRLRSTLFIIALLILVATGIGAFNLKQLNDSQNQAIAISVPKLVFSQKLENLTSEVVLSQRSLSSTMAVGNTDEVESEVNRLKGQADDLHSQISKSGNFLNLEKASFELADASETNQRLIPLIKSIEGIDVELSSLREKLKHIRTRYIDVSEPLLINADLDINLQLRESIVDGYNASVVRSSIMDSVKNKQILSDLTFRFLLVIQLSEDLIERQLLGGTEKLSTTVSHNVRTMAQSLIGLQQSQSRSEIALLIKELRGIVFGSAGILNSLSTRMLHQREFEKRRVLQNQRLTSVSALIAEVVLIARQEIEQSTNNFKRSLKEIALNSLIIVVTILIIVWLVTYYVIEKQINSRLPRLTEAVLSIAKGENQTLADVQGDDELGAMGSSLKIFRKTAQDLRRSNHEMEQFAYAASHDLRSPLRAIENLAQWIMEDSSAELSVQSRGYLEKILERTKRLSNLQTDLLKYSRAGHLENTFEDTNTRELSLEILELLDPSGKFQLIYEGLEEVSTYSVPLRQILLNLFQNAIKHHDTGHGNIKVSVSQRQNRVHFILQDDGPGIPLEFQEKIFQLFQTLQPLDKVEGSGLGLALVQKLVNRYEGDIAVRSNPDQQRGTAFVFDFPLK